MMHEKRYENDGITVIIPCRKGSSPTITVDSLQKQTYTNIRIFTISDQYEMGANFCRNKGFIDHCDTKFVLFSDDDIEWEPYALEVLLDTLLRAPYASYSYGYYLRSDGRIFCDKPFNPLKLLVNNYISTMSLIRSADFVPFDNSLKRLQDWDLWLNLLLNYERVGVYCGAKIFSTKIDPNGLTSDRNISYDEAESIIRKKYNI